MAKEIVIDYGIGDLTLYALVFNSAGLVWNGSAFETINSANWSTYAVAMTEESDTGIYTADFPSVVAGLYSISVRVRAGGSPAVADIIAGSGELDWAGSTVLSSGPNILTAAEAALFLRGESDDQAMLQMLPLIDEYLKNATGHDWAGDSTIHPAAKSAAGMLLIAWYDNPSMVGDIPSSLTGLLLQLEAEALQYVKITFEGLNGAGSISMESAREGASVISLTGVYGLTGDQRAKFESSISEEGLLAQTSGLDLSECQFVVVLKHPAEDVSA